MRHTNLDLRRLACRKITALGARRRRLLNQQQATARALDQVERLTTPIMALLAEIDAQTVTEAAPAAAVFARLTAPPRLLLEFPSESRSESRGIDGLWKP